MSLEKRENEIKKKKTSKLATTNILNLQNILLTL